MNPKNPKNPKPQTTSQRFAQVRARTHDIMMEMEMMASAVDDVLVIVNAEHEDDQHLRLALDFIANRLARWNTSKNPNT